MKDTPAPTDMEARWQRWAAQTRAWGPPGNERLTTSVGLVLLVAVPLLVVAFAGPLPARAEPVDTLLLPPLDREDVDAPLAVG